MYAVRGVTGVSRIAEAFGDTEIENLAIPNSIIGARDRCVPVWKGIGVESRFNPLNFDPPSNVPDPKHHLHARTPHPAATTRDLPPTCSVRYATAHSAHIEASCMSQHSMCTD